jgi:hypothetical protein
MTRKTPTPNQPKMPNLKSHIPNPKPVLSEAEGSKIQNPKSPLEAWFQPMDFTLHLITNSRTIIQAAEISFGRFGRPQPTEAADFTFRLFEHNEDDGETEEPMFRMEGHLLYQTTGPASTLVADLARGYAFGYFSKSTLARPAFFRWHFLELAFFMMLESRGLMGVHGAALVKHGRAILLRASSGGGKTTLAYAGARSKYQALAEDVVWLDARRKVWWGLPWSFHLLPDAKNLFPELAPYEPILQTNEELKLEVDLETIRPGSTTVSAQPGPVVFVERLVGGASRLEPISAADARQAWLASRTGLELKLPHHQGYVDSLLTDDNIFRLYFGNDVKNSVELLDLLFNFVNS